MAKMLAKVGTAGGMFVAAPVVGLAVGEAVGIERGWRRSAIGAGATAIVSGGLAVFKATRKLWLWALMGGLSGSALLMLEQWGRDFWAKRQTGKPAAQPGGAQQETFAYTPPKAQQQAVTVVQPAKERVPTTLEQLAPVLTELIKQGGQLGAAALGSSGTFGPLGSNGTFGPLGSNGVYVPAMAAAAA